MIDDPFIKFNEWLNQALDSGINEANAGALATISESGPTNRIVLFKQLDNSGFVFCTNKNSKKSSDIKYNNNVSLCFYWEQIGKQVRINGSAFEISKEESQEFFYKRDRNHQIGSWCSKQSEELENPDILEKNFTDYQQIFANNDIPCPDYWTGYRIIPNYFEFWTRKPSRLHERICFNLINNCWNRNYLYP